MRHQDDLGDVAKTGEADDGEEQIGQEQAEDERVEDVGRLVEQVRPRDQTVDQQAAQQRRRHRVAGDAEGQHGNQAAADDRVVGGLRTGHGLDRALAEQAGVLGIASRFRAADEGRDVGAGTRNQADQGSDDRRPGEMVAHLPQQLAARPHTADLWDVELGVHALAFGQEQDLRDREQADQGDDHRNPLVKRGLVEGEPQRAGHRVHTDGAEHEPHDAGHQAFERRSGADGADGTHGEYDDPEELG